MDAAQHRPGLRVHYTQSSAISSLFPHIHNCVGGCPSSLVWPFLQGSYASAKSAAPKVVGTRAALGRWPIVVVRASHAKCVFLVSVWGCHEMKREEVFFVYSWVQMVSLCSVASDSLSVFSLGLCLLCSGLVASPSLEEPCHAQHRFSPCSDAATQPVQVPAVREDRASLGQQKVVASDSTLSRRPEKMSGSYSASEPRDFRSSLSPPITSFQARSRYSSRSASDWKPGEGSHRNEGWRAGRFADREKIPGSLDRPPKEGSSTRSRSVRNAPLSASCPTGSSTAAEDGFQRGSFRGSGRTDHAGASTGGSGRAIDLNGYGVESAAEEPRRHWHSRLSPSTMGVISTASTVSSGAEEPDVEAFARGAGRRNRSLIPPLKWTRGGREKLEEKVFPCGTDTAGGGIQKDRVDSHGVPSAQREGGSGRNECAEDTVKKGLLGNVAVNFVRKDRRHGDACCSEDLSSAGGGRGANVESAPGSSTQTEAQQNPHAASSPLSPPVIEGQKIFCLRPSAWAVETAADAYRKELRIRAAVEREKQKSREDAEARAYARSVIFKPGEESPQWKEKPRGRYDTFRPESRPFSDFSTPVPAFSPSISDDDEQSSRGYTLSDSQDPSHDRASTDSASSDREQRQSAHPSTEEAEGLQGITRTPQNTSADKPKSWRRAAPPPSSPLRHMSKRGHRTPRECLSGTAKKAVVPLTLYASAPTLSG